MLQILTPDGWSDFSGIRKTESRDIVHIPGLTCTPEHLILKEDKFVEADSLIECKKTNYKSDVYDVLGVTLNSRYFTNNIVSHNCVFRGSQRSLLSGQTLERLVTKAPVEEIDDLKIYHYPKKNHQYIATVDTSRGVGGDYHAMVMIDVTSKPYEVVATYRNNTLSPLIYPSLIYNIATKYNDAQVLIEINDIGEQTANILYYDLEYENVLGTVTEKNRQIIGFSHDAKMGVRTTTAVKAVGCSTIKTMIEKEQLIINDFETVNEFGTFVPKGRSYEADTGCHDDLVMCLVLFAWATSQKYFIELTDTDFRSNLLNEMNERAMESIAPFGIIENDFGEYTGEVSDQHSFDNF